MINLRRYGKSPFDIAVIHGGPGAGGEMSPVASKLSSIRGVLEPIQTATSLERQVKELKTVLQENADLPVTLIGYSWGAWLGFIAAAHYPSIASKLILIGSAPFEEKYVAGLQETRLSRLSEEERTEYKSIIRVLEDPATRDQDILIKDILIKDILTKDILTKGKDILLARLGTLASKTDAYDPVSDDSVSDDSALDAPALDAALLDDSALDGSGESGVIGAPDIISSVQGDTFQKVWKDAAELRRSGRLLELGRRILCPVVAIHGDYDPHPPEGVEKPLVVILKDFRFIMLKSCGHTPWIERKAKDDFYRILREELTR
jgi:pimeloyl-ACP methyl ester carboxylesterase